MGAFLLERFRSLTPRIDLPQLKAVLEARQQPTRTDGGDGWFSILNISQAETEVTIYDFIGEFGVSAADFIRELAAIKTPKISLRVNSPGGDVFDGLAIFNAIGRHKSEVMAHIDGIAASAASFIVMAADTIVMSPHSQMMIHDAHGFALGPADDMRQMADILDKQSNNLASIYAEHAGGTVEEWRALMKAETFFSDQEAVEAGLADSIDGEDEADVAARMEARVEAGVPTRDHLPTMEALREGTAARRKQPLPNYDFAAGVKEALRA